MNISPKARALIKSLFAVDDKGKMYLRVCNSKPKKLVNAVSTQSSRSLENLLSGCIVLDSDGNPCLNLAVCKFGETTQEAEEKRVNKMQIEKKQRLAAALKPTVKEALDADLKKGDSVVGDALKSSLK